MAFHCSESVVFNGCSTPGFLIADHAKLDNHCSLLRSSNALTSYTAPITIVTILFAAQLVRGRRRECRPGSRRRRLPGLAAPLRRPVLSAVARGVPGNPGLRIHPTGRDAAAVPPAVAANGGRDCRAARLRAGHGRAGGVRPAGRQRQRQQRQPGGRSWFGLSRRKRGAGWGGAGAAVAPLPALPRAGAACSSGTKPTVNR